MTICVCVVFVVAKLLGGGGAGDGGRDEGGGDALLLKFNENVPHLVLGAHILGMPHPA
jgi:hypothetical protein